MHRVNLHNVMKKDHQGPMTCTVLRAQTGQGIIRIPTPKIEGLIDHSGHAEENPERSCLTGRAKLF